VGRALALDVLETLAPLLVPPVHAPRQEEEGDADYEDRGKEANVGPDVGEDDDREDADDDTRNEDSDQLEPEARHGASLCLGCDYTQPPATPGRNVP